MALDTITVTSVSAASGVGAITYNIVTNAENAGGCLSYEGMARVEVWVSSTDSLGSASKVGDAYASAVGVQFTLNGLGASNVRYAWFRAFNVAGNAGTFYPTGSGIYGITSDQVPPDGSVTENKIANGAVTSTKIANAAIGTAHIGNAQITNAKIANLAVDDAKISSLAANKITAGIISATIQLNSPIIQTAASGARIVISKDDNVIRVYDSSGVYVCSIGDGAAGVSFGAIMALIRASSNTNLVVSNSGAGYTINSSGQANFSGDSNRSGVRAVNLGIGANAHAVVFEAATTGGKGVLGVSAAGGGYCLYMNSGTIGPFTAAHPGLIKINDEAEIGDILTDGRVLARIDIDNTITEVARSKMMEQRSVIGVLSKRVTRWSASEFGLPPVLSRLEPDYDYAVVNGVGEGQMNVCGLGGDLEPGDYICASDIQGKGMRQNGASGEPDDFQRRCTVARVRERVTFSYPEEIKRAACIYLCG